ncbi:basic leucine zipper 19-like isoform X2 [Momordica charantia]|uniref:Basic leucine zipper 19-like isoform X2 n=1 Tax=Momordica charantia TaxID=3673 RepID=A0A6J1DBJ1_MOMCH|nr:basic leucine zipper 19-like isoform X2 [Momordica charantia]
MEDYNLQQNNNNPCSFQEIMELCSVTVTSPINVAAPFSVSDSVPVWRRSFAAEDDEASSGAKADGQRSNNALPPFGRIGAGGSGDGKGNATDGGNSDQILHGRNADPNMDPRKLKRIMSNRVSAQKSRLKKVQYVADMERKLKALEAHIAVLSPQVELYRNQQHVLQMEQKRLNQKILSCSRNKLLRDAEIEENRAEVNRLRELHLKQQNEATAGWETAFQLHQYPDDLHPSHFHNMVSLHPNQDNGERTGGGNGPGRFNLAAHHKMVEYKWMPTPGLRQVSEPTSNQLGRPGM